MLQRSSTHIARSESLMDLALGDLYSEKALANGVTTEKADLLFASLPLRILVARKRDNGALDGIPNWWAGVWC
jgi:hypothetical protein